MLPNARLIAQLQRLTDANFYNSKGYFVRKVGSGTYDAAGHQIMTESNIPVEGSFTDKPTYNIWKDHENLNVIQAEFRTKTRPQDNDTFKITERFGETRQNNTYLVVGIADRSEMGFVVGLKAVSV